MRWAGCMPSPIIWLGSMVFGLRQGNPWLISALCLPRLALILQFAFFFGSGSSFLLRSTIICALGLLRLTLIHQFAFFFGFGSSSFLRSTIASSYISGSLVLSRCLAYGVSLSRGQPGMRQESEARGAVASKLLRACLKTLLAPPLQSSPMTLFTPPVQNTLLNEPPHQIYLSCPLRMLAESSGSIALAIPSASPQSSAQSCHPPTSLHPAHLHLLLPQLDRSSLFFVLPSPLSRLPLFVL